MLQPRNRPIYIRTQTDSESIIEHDNVELLHLYQHDSYDSWERRASQPASIHPDFASHNIYDSVSSNHSMAREDADVIDNDAEHFLVISSSSGPTKTATGRPRIKLALLPGWRRTTLLASCVAITSLVINLVAAIWLGWHPPNSGLVELSQGDCKGIQRTDTLIHLAINIISTLLLSGSNFCMQCLSAPTRKEVDMAHRRGNYLDIGDPGIWNLRSVAGHKVILWGLLALSSVPLHLLFNSAVYPSLSAYDYKTTVVTNAFINNTALHSQYLGVNNDLSKYQRLSPIDCITQYAQVFLADRSDLVIVISNSSSSSVLKVDRNTFNTSFNPAGHGSDIVYRPFDWICKSDPYIQTKITVPSTYSTLPCDIFVSKIKDIINDWAPFGYLVDYCLSQPMEEKCSLNGNIPILIAVIISNAVKAAIMLYITFSSKSDPLLTIGDAVSSFLQKPDVTTLNLCLLSRSQVQLSRADSRKEGYLWPRGRDASSLISSTGRNASCTYFDAADRTRWVLTTTFFITCCSIAAAVLGLAIPTISSQGTTLWSLGFGTVHGQAIVSRWSIQSISNASQQVLAAILVANTPQTIFSFLYFSLNGLLTAIWLVSEWADFDHERKFLRVSNPHGQQRSTYFLQLPYKVGIPLLIVSALLHWFVSQSIFLVVVSEWDSGGRLIDPTAIASCGFSPIAMICVLILAALIAATTLIVACRKVKSTMRLAGSCSAAISAACHPPSWDTNAADKPVMWGVTNRVIGMYDVRHCSFSSQIVYPFEEGKEYM